MKKFITENFANIILAISLLTLVKTCGDSRELTKIRKEIQQIKDSTYTLVPIILVALVSISHVTKWYGISNPFSWAIYLSVGIEIAALSALAAISANMGRKVYFPFGIVTLIQFIGNIFFAYQFIDINNPIFKDWVDLVDPLVSLMGVESGDLIGHKRFLAFFSGGMLPLISLSFLHMLVKFEEDEKNKKKTTDVDIEELSKIAGKIEKENYDQEQVVNMPSEEEIKKVEEILLQKDLIEKEVEEPSEKPNEDGVKRLVYTK